MAMHRSPYHRTPGTCVGMRPFGSLGDEPRAVWLRPVPMDTPQGDGKVGRFASPQVSAHFHVLPQ